MNNTSVGGRATLVDLETLPRMVRDQSVQAAQLLKRDVAGVDVIADKASGSWYCLEVNEAPQIASGAFVTEKEAAFANFLHKRLKNA